ncbi:hypothetical protein [Deinococcus cellulosilyticus]|uniref:Uncharacterized protein n=1 Tax=Deinococcus cellulosilyticus (strain DSM 18568 / NBRC 106333 / KACC 11606 / 5516J-15) TaxID=1223518 RepID=A0A511N743_DEIC1|nr:hypothetical protein [Deinococcus cellulosilyticus]GEM48664.1 hypothetical protein DC3_42990 [Deinococcus cellulosilyticus NBRC 106333 = KACC 11606]
MNKINPALKPKVLQVTGLFEGGYLAGDFDGQGASWGPLQWNLGQRTLQPLLKRIVQLDPATASKILGEKFAEACRKGTPEWFFLNVVCPGGKPTREWSYKFAQLYKTAAAQQGFTEFAEIRFVYARAICLALGFETERGFALAFDVAVQNGALKTGPRVDHLDMYRRFLPKGELQEWQKLKAFAHAVARCANPRWYEDVLSRKLALALGGTDKFGAVHGHRFDLEKDFGISHQRKWAQE